jgi:hypothetical protein
MTKRTTLGTVNQAAKAATLARYGTLPPLPSHRDLTTALRQLNVNLQDGGTSVQLYCEGAGWPDAEWTTGCEPSDWPGSKHSEDVPGEGKTFDASAAATRLLSEARQAGF